MIAVNINKIVILQIFYIIFQKEYLIINYMLILSYKTKNFVCIISFQCNITDSIF